MLSDEKDSKVRLRYMSKNFSRNKSRMLAAITLTSSIIMLSSLLPLICQYYSGNVCPYINTFVYCIYIIGGIELCTFIVLAWYFVIIGCLRSLSNATEAFRSWICLRHPTKYLIYNTNKDLHRFGAWLEFRLTLLDQEITNSNNWTCQPRRRARCLLNTFFFTCLLVWIVVFSYIMYLIQSNAA